MDTPSDSELREMWRQAGGKFHGPMVETGTMPESQLLPFLRELIHSRPDDAVTGRPTWLAKAVKTSAMCDIWDVDNIEYSVFEESEFPGSKMGLETDIGVIEDLSQGFVLVRLDKPLQ